MKDGGSGGNGCIAVIKVITLNSTNGVSLGQNYLFVQPITHGDRVQESCLKTEISHFNF